MLVRLAESSEDFRRFCDLIVEYEISLPDDLKHSDLASEVDDLENHYSSPNAAFVATVDDISAGCVAFKALDASTAVIKKMYVTPAYRKFGVARALMAALIDISRERGLVRLVLDTERERLRPAYNLYRSLGFEECEAYGEVDYASPTFMQLQLA